MEKKSLLDRSKRRLGGFAEACGIDLVSVEPGEVTGVCPIHPGLTNPYGYAHGGAIDTMMDTLGGIAASTAVDPPRWVVTRSMDVHYLRPITKGDLRGRAKAVKAGKQVCLVETQVLDSEGRLCAAGMLEFFYVDAP